eukprot:SAG25_NODE_373_length_8948_cov_6.275059_9_plen_163_part_00
MAGTAHHYGQAATDLLDARPDRLARRDRRAAGAINSRPAAANALSFLGGGPLHAHRVGVVAGGGAGAVAGLNISTVDKNRHSVGKTQSRRPPNGRALRPCGQLSGAGGMCVHVAGLLSLDPLRRDGLGEADAALPLQRVPDDPLPLPLPAEEMRTQRGVRVS